MTLAEINQADLKTLSQEQLADAEVLLLEFKESYVWDGNWNTQGIEAHANMRLRIVRELLDGKN